MVGRNEKLIFNLKETMVKELTDAKTEFKKKIGKLRQN